MDYEYLKKWTVQHNGRFWNFQTLSKRLKMSYKDTAKRIEEFLAEKITVEELFKAPNLSDPFITLSDGSVFKCSELMSLNGGSRKFNLDRMRRFKNGKIKEETLFKAPQNKYNRKDTIDGRVRERLTPDRKALLDALQLSDEQIRIQDKHYPPINF